MYFAGVQSERVGSRSVDTSNSLASAVEDALVQAYDPKYGIESVEAKLRAVGQFTRTQGRPLSEHQIQQIQRALDALETRSLLSPPAAPLKRPRFGVPSLDHYRPQTFANLIMDVAAKAYSSWHGTEFIEARLEDIARYTKNSLVPLTERDIKIVQQVIDALVSRNLSGPHPGESAIPHFGVAALDQYQYKVNFNKTKIIY